MNDLIRSARLWLLAILTMYVLLAVSYSLATPFWEAPDEPAHYLYTQYLADHHALPPPQPPQRGHFYEFGYATSLYEWYQQPLYYTLLAPPVAFVEWLKPETGELFPPINPAFERGAVRLFTPSANPMPGAIPLGPRVARFFSVLLGLATLLATYRLASSIAPHDYTLALTVTGLMAFIPQFTFITGYVTNDNLSTLLSTLCLLAFANLLRPSDAQRPRHVVMGLLVSLALLTKLTLLFLLPLGLGYILASALSWHSLKSLIAATLSFMGAALLPTALCVLVIPGMTDQLAFANASFQVKPELLSWSYVVELWPTTLASAWGRFGWMNVVTPTWITNLMNSIALIGLCTSLSVLVGPQKTPFARQQLLLLWFTCLLVVIGFIRFNLSVRQPQGRLLFPALAAFIILVSFGWLHLAGKYRCVVGLGLVGVTLAVNVISFFTALLPAYDAPP